MKFIEKINLKNINKKKIWSVTQYVYWTIILIASIASMYLLWTEFLG